MYKKILVPIDGSPTANLGLREAIMLAKSQKARLLLLHVVDEHYALVGAQPGPYIEDLIDSFRKDGRRIVSRALEMTRRHGVKAQALMLESLTSGAADLIVRQARKWGAQLIVLGTHGRRGVRRLVLGSDAEQVVRMAAVPVLLVRGRTSARGR
jgi:nucleotide-binding universal stress UspA family protein